MIRKKRQTGGLPDPLGELRVALGNDVSRALLVEKGLADIVGADTALGAPDEPSCDAHDRLVAHLDSLLNIDDGLAAVRSAAAGHSVLAADLSRVVDVERGLTQIVEPGTFAEPDALPSHQAVEAGGSAEADDTGLTSDDHPILDSLLKIYGAEDRLRLSLRTGNRYRYLRDAMQWLDSIEAKLAEMTSGNDATGRLRGVSTTLDIHVDLVEQVAAALADALPQAREEATTSGAGTDDSDGGRPDPATRAQDRRKRSATRQRKKKNRGDQDDGATALERGHHELARGNFMEARQYYKEAADVGNADAIVNLAKLWTLGSRGILARPLNAAAPAQLRAATGFYRSLAAGGHADGAWYLAELLSATGASADEIEDCYLQAAALGSRRARRRLLDILRLAAEDGDPDSMSRLATVLHEYGKPSEAQMWSDRAAAARREIANRHDIASSGEVSASAANVDRAALEDEVLPLLRRCAEDLEALADRLDVDASPVSSAVYEYCLWAAKQLAGRLEQIWRALSDFEGADLQSVALDAGLLGLDGVRWSDRTSHQGVTLWPSEMREVIVRESHPVAGVTGVFEVQFRHVVGAER